jgi:hypothetical protein
LTFVDDPFLIMVLQENVLEEYNPSLDVIGDYAQIFIQFGFVTLFVSACPLVSKAGIVLLHLFSLL